jgi:hypothetical protein
MTTLVLHIEVEGVDWTTHPGVVARALGLSADTSVLYEITDESAEERIGEFSVTNWNAGWKESL